MNWSYQLCCQLHWLIQCQVFALLGYVGYSLLDYYFSNWVSSLQDFLRKEKGIHSLQYVSTESKHLQFPFALCFYFSLIDAHLHLSLALLIYFVSSVAGLKYLLQSQFQHSVFLSLLIGPMIRWNSRRYNTAALINFRYQIYLLDRKGQHLVISSLL